MKTAIYAVVAGLFLTGCASPALLPDVSARKKPHVASANVRPSHGHHDLRGYVHRKPVAVDPWLTTDPPQQGSTSPLPEQSQ